MVVIFTAPDSRLIPRKMWNTVRRYGYGTCELNRANRLYSLNPPLLTVPMRIFQHSRRVTNMRITIGIERQPRRKILQLAIHCHSEPTVRVQGTKGVLQIARITVAVSNMHVAHSVHRKGGISRGGINYLHGPSSPLCCTIGCKTQT